MSDSITIHLEAHGALTEQIGHSTTLALAAPYTSEALLQQAAQRWPAAFDLLSRTACARGDTLLAADTRLHDGDAVALIPPVSGGQAEHVARLTEQPLDLAALLDDTADDRCGALVVFGGTVRLHNDGREVAAMDYSAYGPLAERTLADIERETRDAFDVHACRIQHRTGRLGLGEVSVYVVVRAVHRTPAFRAAEYALEELKARVAVWKNEYYADGGSAYLDGTALPRPERPR